MVMQMRGDKCYPGRGKWVKIPLLPENAGKRSLNYLGTLGTLERVMTLWFKTFVLNNYTLRYTLKYFIELTPGASHGTGASADFVALGRVMVGHHSTIRSRNKSACKENGRGGQQVEREQELERE